MKITPWRQFRYGALTYRFGAPGVSIAGQKLQVDPAALEQSQPSVVANQLRMEARRTGAGFERKNAVSVAGWPARGAAGLT